MSKHRAAALAATALIVTAGALATWPAAQAAGPGHTTLPSAVPRAATPAINDGQTNAITQVGSTMVAGGTFTSVTPPGGAATGRSYVVAFDATSGALRTGFNPQLNGTVEDVQPGPTADTVYLAGSFTTVNSTAQSHVALVSVTTGAVVSTFRPAATNGKVNALWLARGRLVLGGNFTTAGGQAHGGLATLNPTTGALDAYMGVDVSQRHNDTGSGAQGAVGVRDLEADSGGSKLAVIGNFKKADGLDRDQVMVVDLTSTGAVVDADWRTRRYEPYCFNFAFDTYVRGVAVAPSDDWFVVTSTGGQNSGTLCDTAARFEFGSTGDDVQPTWVDYSGGDTLWSVDITETSVFVGGHPRWLNNSDASDYAGQGAVPRPGLAALDPDSGMPQTWNPGRNPRGAAAFSLFASTSGLWVGSDTEYFGNYAYRRPRIGFFPLTGGAAPASETPATLPGSVYLGGATRVDQGNVLYRVNAGGGEIAGIDGGPSWTADDGGSNPLRNDGSNAAGWGAGASVDGTVPASTPGGVFDSERWSPSDDPRMSWDFPVAGGVPLQVRLYFANRCTCTSAPGSRVFDVSLDGTTVLDDLDITASVGDQRGTMRSFDITSDGNVDIDFSHVVENPLVNGIEIVRRDLPAPQPPGNSLETVGFDGAAASAPAPVADRGIDWTRVRGAFLVGQTLYTAQTDGYLYRRTFTATQTGAATRLDPYNDPAWNDATTGSGGTFRGALPTFYNEIASLTGMFYAGDRIYYTKVDDPHLYWRWFNADSGIVGSQLFTADGGRDWRGTAGLFRSNGTLYVVRSDGDLQRVDFAAGSPSGAATTVGDDVDWRAKVVFIGPASAPANQAPTASATASCSALTCTLDGTGSTDPDGTIASYAWSWGDGTAAGTGATATHTYAAAGTYTVTLTVRDDKGASASATRTVTVAPPVGTAVAHVATVGSTGNTATPSVAVPASVLAGDQLVLIGSYGVTGTSPSTPAGWTAVSSRQNNGLDSFVWTRRATGADAGTAVATALNQAVKSALVLSVYRGVSPTSPLAATASTADSATATHGSPSVAVPAGGWLLQLWSDKSSSTTAWTAPPGSTVRQVQFGTGSGRVATLTTDSGPLPAGNAGGTSATTDAASSRGISWSIALTPAP